MDSELNFLDIALTAWHLVTAAGAGLLAIILFRVAASILSDRDNRIPALKRMGFGIIPYFTGKVPHESGSAEVAVAHGMGGSYDGNSVEMKPEEHISGRII